MTSPDEVRFATSGHSGEPVMWLRTGEQIQAEVTLLADTVVGQVDRVVNYAPPHHLYGYLLGGLLPDHLGVPVQHLWRTPLTPPDLTSDERTLFVCLPATWLMLRSLTDRIRALPGSVAVHSTGPTTSVTRDVLAALEDSDFRAVELFGSTETGAVAHRSLAPPATRPSLWTLFDDVWLVPDPDSRGEQLLRVSGPRLARRHDMARLPDTTSLDDLVRPAGERHFELLGRSTRLIKINGRRIRLEHVETALTDVFPDLDVVCVPQRDRVRGEHYELFYSDKLGKLAPADIHEQLQVVLPGVPLPRLTHQVEVIPRSPTGKVRIETLLAAVVGHGC